MGPKPGVGVSFGVVYGCENNWRRGSGDEVWKVAVLGSGEVKVEAKKVYGELERARRA